MEMLASFQDEMSWNRFPSILYSNQAMQSTFTEVFINIRGESAFLSGLTT